MIVLNRLRFRAKKDLVQNRNKKYKKVFLSTSEPVPKTNTLARIYIIFPELLDLVLRTYYILREIIARSSSRSIILLWIYVSRCSASSAFESFVQPDHGILVVGRYSINTAKLFFAIA
jgi:hypothetical protein